MKLGQFQKEFKNYVVGCHGLGFAADFAVLHCSEFRLAADFLVEGVEGGWLADSSNK